jgi:hypothetical protein
MNFNSKKSGKVALKHLYVDSSRNRNNLVTVTLDSIGVNNLPNFLKGWMTTLKEDNLIETLLLIAVNQLTFVTVVGLVQESSKQY